MLHRGFRIHHLSAGAFMWNQFYLTHNLAAHIRVKSIKIQFMMWVYAEACLLAAAQAHPDGRRFFVLLSMG